MTRLSVKSLEVRVAFVITLFSSITICTLVSSLQIYELMRYTFYKFIHKFTYFPKFSLKYETLNINMVQIN